MLGLLPQLSRYTLVSALALVLDFTVYLLLAAGGMTGALAGAVGYACGLALHYILSVRYVFDAAAAHKGRSRLIAEFALSGLAGMAITALVIAATVDLGGMPLLPAKVLAVGTSFLVVFALRRGVVFAERGSLPSQIRCHPGLSRGSISQRSPEPADGWMVGTRGLRRGQTSPTMTYRGASE